MACAEQLLRVAPAIVSTDVSMQEVQSPRSPRFGSSEHTSECPSDSPIQAPALLSTSSTVCSDGRGEAEAGSSLVGSPAYASETAHQTLRSASGAEDEDDRSLGDVSSGILSFVAFDGSGSSVDTPCSEACHGEQLPDAGTSEVAAEAPCSGWKDSAGDAADAGPGAAAAPEAPAAAPQAAVAAPEPKPAAATEAPLQVDNKVEEVQIALRDALLEQFQQGELDDLSGPHESARIADALAHPGGSDAVPEAAPEATPKAAPQTPEQVLVALDASDTGLALPCSTKTQAISTADQQAAERPEPPAAESALERPASSALLQDKAPLSEPAASPESGVREKSGKKQKKEKKEKKETKGKEMSTPPLDPEELNGFKKTNQDISMLAASHEADVDAAHASSFDSSVSGRVQTPRSPVHEWGQWRSQLSSIEAEVHRSMEAQATAVLDMQKRLEGVVQCGLEAQADAVSNMKVELAHSCRDEVLGVSREEWQAKICSFKEEVDSALQAKSKEFETVQQRIEAAVDEKVRKQSQDLMHTLSERLEQQKEALLVMQQKIEDDVKVQIDKVVVDLKQEWHERFQVVEGELRGGMVAQATETFGMRRELEECHVRIQAHSEVSAAGHVKLESLVMEKLSEHSSAAVPEKHQDPASDKSEAPVASPSEPSAVHLKLQDEMRSCNSLCEASAASCAEAHAKMKDEVNRRFEAHSEIAMRSQEKASALEEQLASAAAAHEMLEYAMKSKFDKLSETASAASMRSEEAWQRLQDQSGTASSPESNQRFENEIAAASAAHVESRIKLEEDVCTRLKAHEAKVSEKSKEAQDVSQRLESKLASVAASHAKLEGAVSKTLEAQAAAVSAESTKSQDVIQRIEAELAEASASHAKLQSEVNNTFEVHWSAISAEKAKSQAVIQRVADDLAAASASHAKLEGDVNSTFEAHWSAISAEKAKSRLVNETFEAHAAAVSAEASVSHSKLESQVSRTFEAHAATVSAESTKSQEVIQRIEAVLAEASASHAKLESEVSETFQAHAAAASAESTKSHEAIKRIEDSLSAASVSHGKLQGDISKVSMTMGAQNAAAKAESAKSRVAIQRLAENLAATSASHIRLEDEVSKTSEAHAAAAFSQSMLLQQESQRLQDGLAAAVASNAKLEYEVSRSFEASLAAASSQSMRKVEEISKKLDVHSEDSMAAFIKSQEANQRLEDRISACAAAHTDFEDSVKKRFAAHSAAVSAVSARSEDASARLEDQLATASAEHAQFEDEIRQKFESQSNAASAMQAQLHDSVCNEMQTQSSTAALLRAQLENELQSELHRIEQLLSVESRRAQTLEDDTRTALKTHMKTVSRQLDEARQGQAAILGDMLRKTQAAELQRDADYAGMESELQVACQRCEQGLGHMRESLQVHHANVESELQAACQRCDRVRESLQARTESELQAACQQCERGLGRVTESLETHRTDLQEICRRTEQASEGKSAEALGWLKSYAEAHEADRVDAWERIEKEVLDESQEMQAQGRKLRGDFHMICDEQAQALLELRSSVERPLQSLRYECAEVSKQRVAEMAEAQRLEDASLCQAAGVHVMAELHEALEAQCTVMRNMRRRELLGRGAQLSSAAEWRELIDDVRQVMATRYMESLEVCRCAEESLTEAPAEAASMLAAKLAAGKFPAAATNVLSEEPRPQREVKPFLAAAPPAAPAGKRPASARPAGRASHMPPFSTSALQPAAKYPGRLKGAVRGSYEQASNMEIG